MSFAERRRSTRTAVDFFVQERRGDKTHLHPAIDLSVDGLYVIVMDDQRAIDPTQSMDVEFTLPTGTTIRTIVRVAYIDDRRGQRGLGLQFADLETDARVAIERFVEATVSARQRSSTAN